MKLLLKLTYLSIITIFISVISYYDFIYNNSFYHSLIVIAILSTSYCTYLVNKSINELLRIHKKWLGI